MPSGSVDTSFQFPTVPVGGSAEMAEAPPPPTKCEELRRELGVDDVSAPSVSTSAGLFQPDDQWAWGVGMNFAGSGLAASRLYVTTGGARVIGGGSVGRTAAEITRYSNVISGLGIGLTAVQFANAVQQGDEATAGLSFADMAAGAAGFLGPPGAAFAVGYGAARIAGAGGLHRGPVARIASGDR